MSVRKTLILLTSILFISPLVGANFKWEKTKDSVALKNGDKIIWQHVHNKSEGKPYFHPLSTLNGTVLTSLRPRDHVWHRSLWFSWKYINKVNYWEEYKKNTSKGETEIIGLKVKTNSDFSAEIVLNLTYHLPGGEVLLSEKRHMKVSRPDSRGNYHIDWASIFTAAKDIELERTPIQGQPRGKNYGGYAGLSIRAAEGLRNWNYFNDTGVQNALHGKKSNWIRLMGKSQASKQASIGMFEHPSSKGAPNKWYVNKGMPYFSPAIIFDKGFQLKKNETFKLGNRVVIESESRSSEDYNELYKKYAKSALPTLSGIEKGAGEMEVLVDPKAAIKRGELIYNTMCFACHGKDLEGASGFNLKDAEWVHGGTPEKIAENIKKGFPEKGMLAMSSIYSDEQIKDVVTYILSRQEGIRNGQFKVYTGVKSGTDVNTFDFKSLPVSKSANAKVMNPGSPEQKNFALVYNADLFVSKDSNYHLKLHARNGSQVRFSIDGTVYQFKNGKAESQLKDLKSNRAYKLEIVYINGQKNDRFLQGDLTGHRVNIPLTEHSLKEQKKRTFIVKPDAPNGVLILRKRLEGLPVYSIAVAHKEGLNYCVDTKRAAINAYWMGQFLNVAPNINDRGEYPSKIMGDDLMRRTEGLVLQIDGKPAELKYIEYSTLPEFTFISNGITVKIRSAISSGKLEFTYSITGLKDETISFKLPHRMKFISNAGKQHRGILNINKDKRQQFKLIVSP